jgi:hypothetical protein
MHLCSLNRKRDVRGVVWSVPQIDGDGSGAIIARVGLTAFHAYNV